MKLTLLILLVLPLALVVGCSSKEAQSQHVITPQEEHGQRIFAGACAVCHRADSTDPLNGPGLKGVFKKEFLPSGLKATDQQVRETILHGRKNMPPMGQMMNDAQIADLIAYLKTL